jgi:thymidylate synthase
MYFKSFNTADEAFRDLYQVIMKDGEDRSGTKTIHNVGIEIEKPLLNMIDTEWRKWNPVYAEYEWDWYKSGNPNAEEISKRAKIWANMMDENGNVNSNYGYQWRRNDQLKKVVDMLKKDPTTRRASISLYDGKEIDLYSKDTVCTYAINFYIDKDEKLAMQVMMRSNDLVYGFCNDQYCFSNLQKDVANILNRKIGSYFHYVANMHIYERHYNLKNK